LNLPAFLGQAQAEAGAKPETPKGDTSRKG
jgi:hypothetical protein